MIKFLMYQEEYKTGPEKTDKEIAEDDKLLIKYSNLIMDSVINLRKQIWI